MNIKLLYQILTEVQEETEFETSVLHNIYQHLFSGKDLIMDGISESLQEGIMFLQDLVREDGLACLEDLSMYLQHQKQKSIVCLNQAMDRIDRKRFVDDLDHFISFSSKSDIDIKRTSKDSSFRDNILRFLEIDNISTHCPNGSYQRNCSEYFRKFTDAKREGQMYVLEYFSLDGIERCSVGEVINKLIITHSDQDHLCTLNDANPTIIINFNYDKLLESVVNDQVVSDFTFKVGMTSWLLLTQMDHCDPFSNKIEYIGAKFDRDSVLGVTATSSEIFVYWVYLFFAESLSEKKWSILKTPHHLSWVTSDKPGFVVDRGDINDNLVLSRNILKHVNGTSAIYYPLSKEYCLRIETPNKEQAEKDNRIIDFHIVSENEVKEVNELTVCMGKEMVISSDMRMLEGFKLDGSAKWK